MIVIATIAQLPLKKLIRHPEKINSQWLLDLRFNLKRRERLKLSEEKNKVVIKHFSGAKTKEIEPYNISTVEQNPETTIIHYGTND